MRAFPNVGVPHKKPIYKRIALRGTPKKGTPRKPPYQGALSLPEETSTMPGNTTLKP